MRDLLSRCGFTVSDEQYLVGQDPRHAPPPSGLEGEVRRFLGEQWTAGLFEHQARAIEEALAGRDVCLATSTASGKSLVYQAVAAHLVRVGGAGVRVLALYPARALIQDQLEQWSKLVTPLGVRVGYVDGGVPVDRRVAVLQGAQVLLATPDVVHAWMMGRLADAGVRQFLKSVRLLVLDETHVYEGVFGTNMAYLLRRLDVACGEHQIICTTATLGRPADFVEQLTGRKPATFGPDTDAARIPPKAVILAEETAGRSFENTARFLAALARAGPGRFLAFGDSRRMVERLVVATLRIMREEGAATRGGDDAPEDLDLSAGAPPVLPYRAGYEALDRNAIQRSLAKGELAGVVSTSALELGIDIGEIDVVVMLGAPSSPKAFWQRLGRAGRRHPGFGVVLDDRRRISASTGGLASYMKRPMEANWLYLDNRYIQYSHALCAAWEVAALGAGPLDLRSFETLPGDYMRLLANELNPTEQVPVDLYPLKQRAQNDPHHEFLLRSAADPSYQVEEMHGRGKLGNLTLAQVLREGYPGAVYYYMARPYRVVAMHARRGLLEVRREKYLSTSPIAQAKVFPQFGGGTLRLMTSEDGFAAEVEVQASERVLGFVEQRGRVKEEHRYGAGSPFSQRELNRFFQTTGVCWWFGGLPPLSQEAVDLVLEAFCTDFSVSERDLGVGLFFSKTSPLRAERCEGWCIYDATQGSLRLTRLLAAHFSDVVTAAIELARERGDRALATELSHFDTAANELQATSVEALQEPVPAASRNSESEIVAPGEVAIFEGMQGSENVRVVGWRYTPQGVMYELEPPTTGVKRMVAARAVRPIFGTTRLVRVNLVTGEEIG
ncbi:MAG: DEAD/DEAH box helicase [Deltaproteobacteria bacterium]|nr:DEAD/DEAH box helicase [Deltaproteobacteria bacterium]